MKVLAVATINKPLSPEQRQQIMPSEVPATLKLYLDGKIEQFWFRQDKPGVIFLMNVDTDRAGQDGGRSAAAYVRRLRDYELMQVGPLAPLGLLIQGKVTSASPVSEPHGRKPRVSPPALRQRHALKSHHEER